MVPTSPTQARLERLVAATRGPEDARRLGAEIRRLSELFGASRASRKADYMADPALRRAYLAFFLPQYAAKIALLLEQFEREGLLALPARPRVLDVGAGPLSALLGVWLRAGGLGDSVALDLARRVMETGRAILDDVESSQPVRLVEQSVHARPVPPGPFDLIVIAHVLNELGDPRRAMAARVGLVRALLAELAPGGRLLIVEPGTRVHGRALMALRDELVQHAVVMAPCRGAPSCPLLKTPGDWCHGELAWARPSTFQELERASGLRKDVLKHSHLLLARPGDARTPAVGARLVGGLMTDGAGVERRYVCGVRGLDVLTGDPGLPPAVRAPLRLGLLEHVPARQAEGAFRASLDATQVRPSRDHRGRSARTGAGTGRPDDRGPGRRRRR